jgi:hypothetical protein
VAEREVFLGAGVYASFDGESVTLRQVRLTQDLRGPYDHMIPLDPLTYAALVRYHDNVVALQREVPLDPKRRATSVPRHDEGVGKYDYGVE